MGLDKLRKEIDKIDSEIISLLGKRAKIVGKIRDYKKKLHLEIFDSKREKELFNRLRELAKKENLDEGFVIRIFKKIVNQSRKSQKI